VSTSSLSISSLDRSGRDAAHDNCRQHSDRHRGTPEINKKGFVPIYPGPLPMSIDNDLIVGIEAFSMPLVKDIFMAIEQPEDEVHVDPPSMLARAIPNSRPSASSTTLSRT